VPCWSVPVDAVRCGAVWCGAKREQPREKDMACVIADIDVALLCLKVYLFIHPSIHSFIHPHTGVSIA